MISKRLFDFLGLAFWIVVTFGIAVIASQFEPGEWYTSLAKPSWTPPGWLFGPVWGLLYLSMSVAAWLVWRRRSRLSVSLPLIIYLAQLGLNGLWSWLFFGNRLIGYALLDIIILTILITITLNMFVKIDKIAGLLFIPYLIWVCFATALNFQIWRMN